MSEAGREPAGLGCQSRAGGTGLGQSWGQCQGHGATLGGPQWAMLLGVVAPQYPSHPSCSPVLAPSGHMGTH